jgi:hypothetical protein
MNSPCIDQCATALGHSLGTYKFNPTCKPTLTLTASLSNLKLQAEIINTQQTRIIRLDLDKDLIKSGSIIIF